jgi:hypothetical protein
LRFIGQLRECHTAAATERVQRQADGMRHSGKLQTTQEFLHLGLKTNATLMEKSETRVSHLPLFEMRSEQS